MFKGFIVMGVAFGVGYGKGYFKGQNHTVELEKFIQELRETGKVEEFFKNLSEYLKTASEVKLPEEEDFTTEETGNGTIPEGKLAIGGVEGVDYESMPSTPTEGE